MSLHLANPRKPSESGPVLAPLASNTMRDLAETFVGSSAGKGMLALLDQAVVSVTSLLTAVLVARLTSQEELGVYYLVLTLVLFARGAQIQVVIAPFSVYCHRQRGSQAALYAGSVLAHQLATSALATVCLIGLSGVLWLGVGPPALTPVVWVLWAALPILLLREFGRNQALCQLKVASAVVLDVICGVLQLGALLLLARFAWCSVPAVYAAMGAAAAATCLPWFLIERGRWRIRRDRVAADWKQNWSFARWALASHLVGTAGACLMPWIVVAAHGETTAGFFGACGTLAGVANMFVMGLGNFAAPKAARAFADGGKAALCQVLGVTLAVFVGVLGGLCLVSMVIGESLVVFVYGSQYAGGGAVLTVCVASVLALSIGRVAGNGIWAMDRPQANFVPDACALAMTVATALLLVGPFGAMGAALSMLSGTATAAAMKSMKVLQMIRSLSAEPACA